MGILSSAIQNIEDFIDSILNTKTEIEIKTIDKNSKIKSLRNEISELRGRLRYITKSLETSIEKYNRTLEKMRSERNDSK